MKKIYIQFYTLITFLLLIVVLFAIPSYSAWGKTDRGGIYWAYPDNTFARDGWKLIDDDNDGIGEYFYFNENGFVQLDDIMPDFKIVDKDGRQIDNDGNVVHVKIEEISGSDLEEGIANEVYSEEILAQIKSENNIESANKGFTSSGQTLYAAVEEDPGPKPSDNIVIDTNPDGTAKWILGPNVVLKEKNSEKYDPMLDRNMAEYVKTSDKFSKSVNGTTFTKSKWKGVMALKGTGATVVFENPKHNFNKLKGRIATHYFTYTDRTTQCIFKIIDEDTGEELYNTSAFNYNSGCSFECDFRQRTSAIRFELEVTGQYTSRVCYLRNCTFGFDKAIWEDEQYENEVEGAYREKYGTESEAEYVEEEEVDDGMGERSVEGEDPSARYKRLNSGSTISTLSELERLASMNFDEEDDSISAELRASISEARRILEEIQEKRNSVSGPAFDEELKKAKPVVGPGGFSNIIEGHEGGESD